MQYFLSCVPRLSLVAMHRHLLQNHDSFSFSYICYKFNTQGNITQIEKYMNTENVFF